MRADGLKIPLCAAVPRMQMTKAAVSRWISSQLSSSSSSSLKHQISRRRVKTNLQKWFFMMRGYRRLLDNHIIFRHFSLKNPFLPKLQKVLKVSKSDFFSLWAKSHWSEINYVTQKKRKILKWPLNWSLSTRHGSGFGDHSKRGLILTFSNLTENPRMRLLFEWFSKPENKTGIK